MKKELRLTLKNLLDEEIFNKLPTHHEKRDLFTEGLVEKNSVILKGFSHVKDVDSNCYWLVPQITRIFLLKLLDPEMKDEDKRKYLKNAIDIKILMKYVSDYIFELDGHTEKINRNNKSSKQIDSSVSEKNEQEKVNLHEVVSSKLKEKEAKQKVLEKFPKNVRKANKVWKLSTTQIYNKYFEQDFPNLNDKNTIIRYIKKFRSEQK